MNTREGAAAKGYDGNVVKQYRLVYHEKRNLELRKPAPESEPI